MTSLGTARADPGEMDTGRLTVGEGPDGGTVGLPVAVINGAQDGKTLYLQAASDGDELNGVGVVRQIVPQLNPQELSGTLLIVGIANYFAFQRGEHRNPVDDTKLNRTYPGDENGTSTERIAAGTFEAARRADLILDLHQGSTSRMINEVRVRCGKRHRIHDDCLELAKVFGCGHILDQKGPEGQLARAAPDKGIPTVDPELGGSVGFDQESIEIGVEGIFNVLKHYDFLPESVGMYTQTRAGGFEQYGAPSGGIVDFKVDLGDRVGRNRTLFEVTDVFGRVKATVSADSEGIFWRTRRRPQVASGEYVCSIGTNVDSY